MTTRKINTIKVTDVTPSNHLGRLGEITYRAGFLYYHDGATAGGEVIGGGSGSGGPTSWASVTGKPSFATVATSGSYADLTGKPSIPTIPTTVSSFTNDAGYLTSVGTISYNDLSNKPSLFSGAYADLTGTPSIVETNQTLNTGDSVSFNRLTVTGASGIEGGEIQLAKAPNSSLAGDVIIDVYENKLRFFEGGGNGRGFYLDLTTGANNTSTNIMSGGSGFSGSYNDLTDKPALFSGDYDDLTDKPTIPTSFSSLVNGSYTASLGTDGALTLPAGGDILVDDGKIISADGEDFKIIVQDSDDNGNRLDLVVTDGTDQATRVEVDIDGMQINTNLLDVANQRNWRFKTDGSTEFPDDTISQYSSLKIKSGASSSTAIWTFGTDGGLTLPAGGNISESGGLTGAIKLTPTGGANEYQALLIYPTGTADGDHIHLTAGGGTTDLYLGNDLQYVKIEHGGNVVIHAFDSTANGHKEWLFDKNGDLTAPRNIILNNPVTTVTTTVTGTVADSTGNPFTFRILKSANPQLVIPFADPNFVLKWTGSDAGSVAAGAQAPGGQGPSSLVSDDGTYWNFNSWFGLNGARPNTGTVFSVEYGVVVSDTMISTTATNLVIEADAKQYRFGTDGNITLPAGGSIVDSAGANVFVSLATLKQVVADSTDFADFKSRIAGM